MAVTTRRWWLGLLLALALVGVQLLPPSGFDPTGLLPRWLWHGPPSMPMDSLTRQLRLVDRELNRAQQRLASRGLRDSLAHWAPPGGPSVRLVLQGEVPGAEATRARQLHASLQAALDSAAAPPGLVVLVVQGGARATSARDLASQLVLPPAGVAGTCALSVPARVLARPAGVHWVEGAIAPCLFYAAYGPPGQEVERWLARRGFDLVRRPDPRGLVPPPAAPALELITGRSPLAAAMLGRDWRDINALDLVGCQAGQRARCEPALLQPQPLFGRPTGLDRTRRSSSFDWRFWSEDQARGDLLGSLVREFGPERFQHFWRSAAPVPEAFEVAFGVSFEGWAARWVPERLGRTVTGPSLRWAGVTGWLGLAVLAVLAAAFMAERRRAR